LVKDELKFDLAETERVLWTGEAGTGIKFAYRDLFFIPLSIVFFTFAVIWEVIALIGVPFPGNLAVSLIGGPFLLFGFYMVIGRFWYDMRRRANTIYMLTTERLIIQSGVFKREVETFDIQKLAAMTMDEKRNGFGTIKLDADNPRYSGWKSGYVRRKVVWALEYIPNVRDIYNLILERQETLNKRSLIKHLKEITSIPPLKG